MAILLLGAPAFADEAPRRTVSAVRVATAPVIDGDLSDAAWNAAPEITGFTQHDPDDGRPATEKTVVKVVYDDAAIYVGATLYDDHPVTTLLGRRDNSLESDWFRVIIDSQHDRLTAAGFWVNPSNVQSDMIFYNDIYSDSTWDAVWASGAKIVPGGWSAEIRIPYSQLRFPDTPDQTWGVNFVRQIVRNQEQDRLVNTPKGETGYVSRFADLTGLSGLHPERSLEVVPYGVTRSDLRSRLDGGDPFLRPTDYEMDAGVDIKYGITPGLTLTGTINPDFGQVEVDPAVVNLSAFETFYPEKRPFFTEGAQMFRYGQGPAYFRVNFNIYPPQWFYSRRIGRAPQASVGADYADAPGETTILGAAKVTGRVGKGWSLGVLDAVTDRERGRFQIAGNRWSQTVEPMSNYLVARAAKEYGAASRIGVLFTSVNRKIDGDVQSIRSNAYEAGVDGYTRFDDKNWLFEWLAGTTLVDGTAAAMSATQNSSARYYGRPDADYLESDPARRSLSGFGGRAMLARQTGKWRPNFQLQTYSPGFEVNDVGYMQRVDIVNAHAVVQYLNEDVRKHVRSTSFWVGQYNNWNYGKDLLANGLYGSWDVVATNYWEYFGSLGVWQPTWDDRKTRGGPVVQVPGGKSASLEAYSDARKKLSFNLAGNYEGQDDGGAYRSVSLGVTYRPTAAISLSVSPSFTRDDTLTQYVATLDAPAMASTYGKRYVFAHLDQRSVDFGTRVDWTLNARLSFQLYVQPFIASGDYHQFQELARPRSADYRPAPDAEGIVGNPDFNFRSVRGSGVVRWEFRPGSALYVVWNENRADVVPVGDFRLRRDLRAIPSAPSRDVFLVKVSYWLPL